jgi:signal transduction histidine kinase
LLRDGALLAYTGYVATVFVYYLFANGVAAALLPDAPGWLMNLLVGGSGFTGVFAALAMWSRLLDLQANFPRLTPLYRGVGLLALAAVPTAVTPYYSIANPVVMSITALVTLLSLALTVWLIRRNRSDVSLRFYLASTFTSMVGLVLAQLALRGGLPVDYPFADPYQLASILAVVILGVGLALRIRRLQTERLRAQQETAFATRRAEEQRGFVAMLSHEFRTPLASIDNAMQMVALGDEGIGPATVSRLDRVRATTRKLADLVDMFLSSDALDQGALALRQEPVPLGELLESALDGLREGEAGARLVLAIDAPERPVRVDPQFLGVAVCNLVRNALRYSPPDTPVTVTVRGEPDGIAISVTDRGRGMTPGEVERIGSIYFRAASAAGTKGAGVGLYLTQKIVAAHGGTLQVDSAAGQGSVFTIHLPDAGPPPLRMAAQ